MLVDNTPARSGIVLQLGMNARYIHIILEELCVRTLTSADNGSVDALYADIEARIIERQDRHALRYGLRIGLP